MIPFRQFLKETLEKRHQIPTPLKRSEHSGLDVFGEWRAGDRQGKSKVVSVHPKHIRATQEWVDKRWDGKERSTESSHKEAPAGIRTKDGNVHSKANLLQFSRLLRCNHLFLDRRMKKL